MISMTVYFLQLIIFKIPHDTYFYLFQDLAFLPVSVLLVTLVIDKLLKKREKRSLLNKLNMVVGTFFGEMGQELLKRMSAFDGRAEELQTILCRKKEWNDQFFRQAQKAVKKHEFDIDIKRGNLQELKEYLVHEKECLLRMLENPNLLEHDSFTDLLWALSHLVQELSWRKDLQNLSENDAEHLALDLKRAYVRILERWLDYMKHLRDDYPYLYSFARRINPFDPTARVEFD
jgi:hypothetical protein